MDKNDPKTTIGYMPMPTGFPYRSIFLKGRPQHEKYDDFWCRHPPMDITHRAKIFSAFDALAGFDDCIASKEIEYSARRDLSEGEKEDLDRKLAILQQLTRNGREARKNRPEITVCYFSPCTDVNSDAYGTEGICKTVTGICRKVNAVSRSITIGETILALDDILAISGDLFEGPDDDIP